MRPWVPNRGDAPRAPLRQRICGLHRPRATPQTPAAEVGAGRHPQPRVAAACREYPIFGTLTRRDAERRPRFWEGGSNSFGRLGAPLARTWEIVAPGGRACAPYA